MIHPICTDMELLKTPSRPAVKKDIHLARDLTDTLMAHPECVGMAADMIGHNVCLLAAKVHDAPLVMFNPVIKAARNPYDTQEGCLCHMGTRPARHYETIEVDYRDRHWKKQTARFSGLTAQIIQHEMDHMKGILI